MPRMRRSYDFFVKTEFTNRLFVRHVANVAALHKTCGCVNKIVPRVVVVHDLDLRWETRHYRLSRVLQGNNHGGRARQALGGRRGWRRGR